MLGDVERRGGGDDGQSSAGVLGGGRSAGTVLWGAPQHHEAEAVLRGGGCESKQRGVGL